MSRLETDQQYLHSIVNRLYEPSLRPYLSELREEVRDLIDPRRKATPPGKRKRTDYQIAFPSLAAVFRWLNTPLDDVSDPKKQSNAVSPRFRQMLGHSSQKAGKQEALGIYAWFHILHPTSAKSFLDRVQKAAPDGIAIPEFRPLSNPPYIFKDWLDYARVVLPEIYKNHVREREVAAGYGLGLVRPRPTETDQRSALEMRYFNEATAFVGRTRELAKLDHFIKRSDPFVWWQIAGPAGQGKSRIALKLIDDLKKKNWEAGFVTPFDEQFLETLTNYHVVSPTLLVVDYASDPDRSRLLGRLIAALAKFATTKNLADHPVRLLVLERQPYDGLFKAEFGKHPEDWSSPWHHLLFAEDAATTKAIIANVADRECALSLSPLTDEQMRVVARSWIEKRIGKDEIEKEHLEAVDEFLGIHSAREHRSKREADLAHRPERLQRPLFAILAADAVLQGKRAAKSSEGSTMQDLLDFALDHDARQVFSNTSDRRPILGLGLSRGSDVQQNLAILANVVRHFDVLDHLDLDSGLISDEIEDVQLAHRLLGYPVFVNPGGTALELHAREPDLLAEYQVLRLAQKICRITEAGKIRKTLGKKRLDRLLNLAWQVNSGEAYAFLNRLYEDFNEHPAFVPLLLIEPDQNSERGLWAEFLARVAGHGQGDIALPALEALKRSMANSDCGLVRLQLARALLMLTIRFCRENEPQKAAKYYYWENEVPSFDPTEEYVFLKVNAALWLSMEFAEQDGVDQSIYYWRSALQYHSDEITPLYGRDQRSVIFQHLAMSAYKIADGLANQEQLSDALEFFEEAERYNSQSNITHSATDRAAAAITISTLAAINGDLSTAIAYRDKSNASLTIANDGKAWFLRRVADVAIADYQVQHSPLSEAQAAIEEFEILINDLIEKLHATVSGSPEEKGAMDEVRRIKDRAALLRFKLAVRYCEERDPDKALKLYNESAIQCLHSPRIDTKREYAAWIYALCGTIINFGAPGKLLEHLDFYLSDLAQLTHLSNDKEIAQIQTDLHQNIRRLQQQ